MPTWAKRTAGFGGKPARDVPDGRAALAALAERLRPGDVVLVKASRAAGLQAVALELTEEEATR